MRVISGWLGGRIFEAPKGHKTHPMSDKARGGLFSTLGDIKGLTVLDCFGGSGALAIEAVSRGAKHAITVDNDTKAYQVTTKNIKSLGIEDRCSAIRANISAWSNRHPNDKFDLVVCDPPYDDIQYKIIRKITKHLGENGVFVLSLPGKHESLNLEGLQVVQIKDYGDAQLIFYKLV